MYRNFNSANSQLDKVMTNDQFNQVVDAIISGKYSWACLLILRFAGYNPLHYIPYRTYNRLMKSHRDITPQTIDKTSVARQNKLDRSTKKSAQKLRDLCYLEDTERTEKVKVKGGIGFSWGIIPKFVWSKAENSQSDRQAID